MFGHVARLQPEVPATTVLSTCCAASDNTPQPGWHRPRGRCHISWLHKPVLILTFRLLTLWTLPLIGPHGEQSRSFHGLSYMMR